MPTPILSRYCFLLFTISIIFTCIYYLLHVVPETISDPLLVAQSKRTSKTDPSQLPSSLFPSGSLPRELCNLSWAESDGWFCEFDEDWKRRKRNDRAQHRQNRFNEVNRLFFQNNWEPTLQCAFEQRVGIPGDGGKWVCDIHKLEGDHQMPLIYSAGSSGNFVFEEAVKMLLPRAEIHTFDAGIYGCKPQVCTFHPVYISDGKASGSKSFKTIIDALGHKGQTIDILKIDIEGNEYLALEALFSKSSNTTTGNDEIPYIRQILIEFHLQNMQGGDIPISRVHGMFELLRANNYVIFHKEPNLNNANNVCEYGFIRMNPAFFVPPS